MLRLSTPVYLPARLAPLLPYQVTYYANFPTGEPVPYKLDYQARDAEHAREQFERELLRANRFLPLGYSWTFFAATPAGSVND